MKDTNSRIFLSTQTCLLRLYHAKSAEVAQKPQTIPVPC